jgi:N-acetylglutamate synthase-like GNAT family acetyltransferase
MHGGIGMVAERAAAATGEVTISETRDVPIPALRALHETAPWARGRSHVQLRTLLRHSDIFLTAWDGNTLVGCARVLTDFTVRALICDVIVRPAYQGRGVGRLLVEAVKAHPALQHVEMLCLFTTEKRDFYAHLGWEDHPGYGMIMRRH